MSKTAWRCIYLRRNTELVERSAYDGQAGERDTRNREDGERKMPRAGKDVARGGQN